MPDTTIPPQFAADPTLEAVFTPDLAIKQGWELVDILDEARTYRRHRALEAMHYVITRNHRVETLTLLQPRQPYLHHVMDFSE